MKNLRLLFIFFIITGSLYAQSLDKEANTNFIDENYRVALKQYLKLLGTDKKNDEYQYRIGVCYLNTNVDKSKAVDYLEFADSLEYFEEDVKLNLAKAYMHKHEFDKAINTFKSYKEKIRDKIDTETIREINRYVEMCENAKQLTSNPLNLDFVNLGTNINSRRSDYHPHVTPDGSFMVFSSNKRYIRDYQQYVENCYYSLPVRDDFGEWSKNMQFGRKVNTEENENVVGLAHDGTKAIIHLDNIIADNDIGISERRGTRFKEVEVFNKEINSKYSEEGACFSVTGDTLYFSSNRKGGQGGFDLYYSVKQGKEEWSSPKNLGTTVNSKYDENFPEMSANGKTLRYASKGFNTMGGYDIFESTWDEKAGNWRAPKNIGFPVNDTYDNLNISITSNGRYGYMSKWRKESVGDLDIYKVIFKDVPATKIKYFGIIAIGDTINPKQLTDVSNEIKMKVLEKISGNVVVDLTEMAKQGKYEFEIDPGNYDLVIKGEAYELYHIDLIIYEEQPRFTELKFDIYLQEKKDSE